MSWLGSKHKNCSVTLSRSTALRGPQFFSICVTRCLTTSCVYENIQFPGPALEVLIPEKRVSACNAPLWVILMCQQLDTMARPPVHCADLRFCLKKKPEGKSGTWWPLEDSPGESPRAGGWSACRKKVTSPRPSTDLPHSLSGLQIERGASGDKHSCTGQFSPFIRSLVLGWLVRKGRSVTSAPLPTPPFAQFFLAAQDFSPKEEVPGCPWVVQGPWSGATEGKGPFSYEKRKELEFGGQKHFSAENSRKEDQSG